MGDVGHKFPAQPVDGLQAFELFADLPAHDPEGGCQVTDLVPSSARSARDRAPPVTVQLGQDLRIETAVGRLPYVPRKGPQPMGQKAEYREPGEEREQDDAHQGADGVGLDVAAADRCSQRLVFLTAENGVQVALDLAALHNRVGREDLPP